MAAERLVRCRRSESAEPSRKIFLQTSTTSNENLMVCMTLQATPNAPRASILDRPRLTGQGRMREDRRDSQTHAVENPGDNRCPWSCSVMCLTSLVVEGHGYLFVHQAWPKIRRRAD